MAETSTYLHEYIAAADRPSEVHTAIITSHLSEHLVVSVCVCVCVCVGVCVCVYMSVSCVRTITVDRL